MSIPENPDYVPIPLSKLHPDEPLPTDIFLLINKKYIKYKNAQDSVTVAKYDLFLSKNVASIYIAFEDVEIFIESIQKCKDAAIDSLVEQVGEEHRDLAEARVDMAEKVYQTFAVENLDREQVSILKGQVEDLIDKVSGEKVPMAILAKLTTKSQAIAEHSVNVANISVFIAMAMGHAHQYVLENIYMGALFHDYGKAKIPSKVLEDPSNITYSNAIEGHPAKGAALLSKIESISEQVLSIVLEHHEQHNGKGFPAKKKGEEIYELAKIVSLANVFDNICSTNTQRGDKEMYKQAIKFLKHDNGKKFDPDFLGPVLDALYKAYR